LKTAAAEFYNSLEAPAFEKFPILKLYQEFLLANGALTTLMSGSGSTTFAIVENISAAEGLAEKFKSQFGANCWTAAVGI
jgi:4-diphosphocytidyl-2-C-methyl-D-erythritol kinase